MCTAITHAFVALAAGRAWFPLWGGWRSTTSGQSAGTGKVPLRLWVLAPICAAGPDLDVGLFSWGVQYENLWGHRGMTHSLLFAAVLALIVVTWLFRDLCRPLSRRWWSLTAFFFLVTASHGVLDAFTDGGLGIAFFSPFDTKRYFMPWTPIVVPHFGLSSLFTPAGARTLISELLWVWLPVGLVCGSAYAIRRRSTHQALGGVA